MRIKNILVYLILLQQIFSQSDCDSITIKGKKNLGIYGGIAMDLSYLNSNNRLFAGSDNSRGLYFSDDTCKTWYPAYPDDSLDFECGERGWGGSCTKVLTNNKGWVLAYNNPVNGLLLSSVINHNNGNNGSWQTFIDKTILKKLQLNDSVSFYNIALNDYYAYTSAARYIILKDTRKIDTANIIDIVEHVQGIPDHSVINNISVVNHPSGFPIYVSIDTLKYNLDDYGELLYKIDSNSYTLIPLPSNTKSVSNLFVQPQQSSGDTIYISANDPLFNSHIYRSYDGGNTWNDITPTSFLNSGALSKIDYSFEWKNIFSGTDGVILSIAGKGYSYDNGTSWLPIHKDNTEVLIKAGFAIHPLDTSIIIGANPKEIVLSTNGRYGSFAPNFNTGYEGVRVMDIERNKNKTLFYLATYSGLAYTTAYLNDTLNNIDKWKPPFGNIPANNNTDNYQYTSIAINPTDSLHVVAGFSDIGNAEGFSVTKTGPDDFENYFPAFKIQEKEISDIEFITSDIVLAVTSAIYPSVSSKGEIWRSVDGGINWSKVTPTGFAVGNDIAVATNGLDTVIYVASGYNYKAKGVLWRSDDQGISWININSGPKSYSDSSSTELPILSIDVYPGSLDTLYMACGRISETEQAFVVSYDGGLTYKYIDVLGELNFEKVKIHPEKPDSFVYVTNNREIFCYIPVMDTVFRVYKGLPGEEIPSLNIGSLLCGSSTGFYSLDLETIDDIITLNKDLSDNTDKSTVKIYPNPSNGYFTIEFKNAVQLSENTNISISDITGKRMTDFKYYIINEKSINLTIPICSSGMYYFNLTTDKQKYTSKFILTQ